MELGVHCKDSQMQRHADCTHRGMVQLPIIELCKDGSTHSTICKGSIACATRLQACVCDIQVQNEGAAPSILLCEPKKSVMSSAKTKDPRRPYDIVTGPPSSSILQLDVTLELTFLMR